MWPGYILDVLVADEMVLLAFVNRRGSGGGSPGGVVCCRVSYGRCLPWAEGIVSRIPSKFRFSLGTASQIPRWQSVFLAVSRRDG